MSNTSSCIIVYTLCICLRTVLRKLCCCAIHLHCVYTWIYCQQSSDPAINNCCVDLLRVFSLLFIVKAVSIIYLRQRPHVALQTLNYIVTVGIAFITLLELLSHLFSRKLPLASSSWSSAESVMAESSVGTDFRMWNKIKLLF